MRTRGAAAQTRPDVIAGAVAHADDQRSARGVTLRMRVQTASETAGARESASHAARSGRRLSRACVCDATARAAPRAKLMLRMRVQTACDARAGESASDAARAGRRHDRACVCDANAGARWRSARRARDDGQERERFSRRVRECWRAWRSGIELPHRRGKRGRRSQTQARCWCCALDGREGLGLAARA